ncbi:MAG: hypothetical protein HeimC3_27730 [Candidatus Heimdallarchaeota archaeon LC_3]|nr:MAG: hypothetical protein HeimC3_27730 [Candidatus Heimdallarchaeota archaeon LC_3]
MNKSFDKLLNLTFLLIAIFTFLPKMNGSLNFFKPQDYRVQFNPEDVLMNTTLMMTRGNIIEKNITITDENKTLTLVTEILRQTGRLWGLYIENSSFYYNAKETQNYAGFEKLMDHVSNYTVKHVTKIPGDYVLAFHDSHLHEEPDTHFNTLVLRGHLGKETIVMADMMEDNSHDMSSTSDLPTTSFSTVLTFIALVPFGIFIKYRKTTK